MNDQQKSFLGKGWSFPPSFDKSRAEIQMVIEDEDIKESLQIYFSTRIGERIVRQDYGCIIYDYLFQSANSSTLSSIELSLTNMIREYEPRILVHQVKAVIVDEKEGIININVEYEIQSTNTRDNIVFPFYINEGTSIRS